jgi:hypothetical protein
MQKRLKIEQTAIDSLLLDRTMNQRVALHFAVRGGQRCSADVLVFALNGVHNQPDEPDQDANTEADSHKN